MEFVVGKKYHKPSSDFYLLIHAVFNDNSKEIITYTVHAKSNDKQYHSYWTNPSSNHKTKVPYTTTVTHERWIAWYRFDDGITSLTFASEEELKSYYYFKNTNTYVKFLHSEKITYTETIEE